ncbi:MAG: hypothetical protein OQJ99_03390 [Rhodospirillales bacterium]|nr:hypothetical protein [Rhodospirillales bacterium]MCW8862605.1 hypothetical protein [Rhodospirillales bacterium]MCW8951775.1 hypothetical protein [Rhodospirillales bacterium]MCW8970489.1 hypothetical protein [Rhodospirillales bacterium]MCW9002171.1 hypothetical protein [Rhodospirillales bacterium]
MEALWTQEYAWVWMVLLGLALFFPVRKLIWTLSVRRTERREGPTDEAQRASLMKRASVTAALLSFVFAALYGNIMFMGK